MIKRKPFRQMLAERQIKTSSLLCVGLDPLMEKMPVVIREVDIRTIIEQQMLFNWMTCVVDAVAPYTCMFKTNHAHWEAIVNGVHAMTEVIAYIHRKYPDIPVVMDCKRGDIGRTQERYGVAHFDHEGADGMNFTPYMGEDTVSSLAKWGQAGRALVGVCYTSNLTAREMQDIPIGEQGIQSWDWYMQAMYRWFQKSDVLENAGLVMAAAHKKADSNDIQSDHLKLARLRFGGDLWYLIPGVGTQGGFIEQTVEAAFSGIGSIAINCSSSILFASSGDDFAEAAALEAKKMRELMKAAIPKDRI
ncbi:MAG: orotidine-5'-phosphate decarboxylase [Candidatus Komeilibacteria bacterium]